MVPPNNPAMPADPTAQAPSVGGGQPAGKIPEADAGYMELSGATKDADCNKVNVEGGVSSNLGCCNYFEPQDDSTDKFSCGTCQHVEGDGQGPADDKAQALPSDHPLNKLRAKRRNTLPVLNS